MLNLEQIKSCESILESLSENEISIYLKSKSFYNIEFFSDYFLSHWKTKDWKRIKSPWYHKEIWEALDKWENINVIIARGHGKTTSLLIWILHALLFKKHKEIIYIASGVLGEEGVWKIRQELSENKLLRIVFRKLTPWDISSKESKNKKWRQKELDLINWTRLLSLTKGQSIRWKRPSKIIVDDPQENSDVESKIQSDKFNTWFFSSLFWTLMPWWSISVFGTIIWNLCLVKHLRDEKNWQTIEYKAIMNGSPIWPDIWSLETLKERKNILWSAIFNQEYLNIPLSRENALIKEDWLMYYSSDTLLPDFEHKVMAVDPATSEKEKADFTGISVVGFKWGKKYVLYSKWVKLSPTKLENFILSIYDRFEPDIVVQESNIEVKLLEDLKKKWLPLREIRAKKDKYTRLLEVSNLFEFKEVYFARQGQEEAIYQATNFPDTEHDDVLDSLVYALLEGQKNTSGEDGVWVI